MKCDEIKEILSSYVDGEAGADERRLVDEHLAACAACRDLARRMRLVGTGIGKTEGVVPPDFRDKLFARMEREDLLPRRRSLFAYSVRWAAVPIAAAAVLALFLLTSREAYKAGPGAPGAPRQAMNARPPSAQDGQGQPPSAGGQASRPGGAQERAAVAARGPEPPAPAAGTGAGGHAVADARTGADLTAEERDIVAHLDVLEDPSSLDAPSEIDELEIVEPAVRTKG